MTEPLEGTGIGNRSLIPQLRLPGCFRDTYYFLQHHALEGYAGAAQFSLPTWTSKTKNETGKGDIHLEPFEDFPRDFSNFKRQLPLCDALANSLAIHRQDLAITLVKTPPTQRFVGLTFDGPILRPGN